MQTHAFRVTDECIHIDSLGVLISECPLYTCTIYCICVDHVYMYLQQVKEILQEEEDLSEIVQLVGKVRPLLYTPLYI